MRKRDSANNGGRDILKLQSGQWLPPFTGSGGGRPLWRHFWFVMAAGAVLRLLAAISGDWTIRTDELFQYLEQAHRVVFGGQIPWEFRFGERSWLLPALSMPPLYLAKILGGNRRISMRHWYFRHSGASNNPFATECGDIFEERATRCVLTYFGTGGCTAGDLCFSPAVIGWQTRAARILVALARKLPPVSIAASALPKTRLSAVRFMAQYRHAVDLLADVCAAPLSPFRRCQNVVCMVWAFAQMRPVLNHLFAHCGVAGMTNVVMIGAGFMAALLVAGDGDFYRRLSGVVRQTIDR